MTTSLARNGLFITVAPPVFAFFLAKLTVTIGASFSDVRLTELETYSRYDSAHYLSIATQGYSLYSCAQVPGYNPKDWCGNAGWMPLFPGLLWFLSFVSSWSPLLWGITLTNLGFLGLLICIWLTLGGYTLRGSVETSLSKRLLALIAVACCPGNIYFHAVFPISLFALLLAGFLLQLARNRWLIAGSLGAAAACAYSTGFLLCPICGIWGLLSKSFLKKSERLRWIAGSSLALCGFLMTMVIFQLTVGRWDAFFKVQAKYGHGVHNPLYTLAHAVFPLFNSFNWKAFFPAAQTLLVAILMTLAVFMLMIRRAALETIDKIAILSGLLFWIFPLIMGGGVSLYRSEALLFPVFFIVRHFPLSVTLPLVICLVFNSIGMAWLFFRGVLV